MHARQVQEGQRGDLGPVPPANRLQLWEVGEDVEVGVGEVLGKLGAQKPVKGWGGDEGKVGGEGTCEVCVWGEACEVCVGGGDLRGCE